MKIVCLRCKKTIGEQAPYDNPAEVKAKCTGCLEKEKAMASCYKPSPELKGGQEVTLDCGAKGRLWAVKDEAEKLSLWDMAVAGRKFYYSDNTREGSDWRLRRAMVRLASLAHHKPMRWAKRVLLRSLSTALMAGEANHPERVRNDSGG